MEDETKTAFVHKSTLTTRWFMLLFGCTVMMGQYYTYDNPAALQNELETYFNSTTLPGTRIEPTDFGSFFNALYSFYSLPNMILPLFGGVLVDYLGARIMIIILISLVTAGQTLTAFGIQLRSPAVSLAGRFLFGLGGETLSAASSTMLAQWFKGKELALSMGINLSISRLGSVFNDNLSPILESQTTLGLAGTFYFGSVVLCVSIFCSIVMFFLDRSAERHLKEVNGEEAVLEKDASAENKSFIQPLINVYHDIKSYSAGFWLLLLSCVLVYGAIIPFNSISKSLLTQKFGLDSPGASAVMGIPFLISAISTPFLGGLIDKFGYRAILILVSSSAIIFVHTCLYLMPGTQNWFMYVPFVVQGVAYSIYSSALWPSIAYVVEDRLVGTAYGLTTATQNIGLTCFPLIIGALNSWLGSYTDVEPFFALLGVAGVVIAIFLNIWDRRNGSVLNSANYVAPVKEVDAAPLLSEAISVA